MKLELNELFKKKWFILLSWQLLSLILCGSGTICKIINNKYERTIPLLMVSISYIFIFLLFCWNKISSNEPFWKYFLISFLTIVGDFTIVYAYNKTSLASIMILCTTSAIWVVPISFFITGRKINIIQFFGIILGIFGGTFILIADGTSGITLIGNIFALLSAICYSLTTVLQEVLIQRGSYHSYLFLFSIFSLSLSIPGSAIFEWKLIKYYKWDLKSILLFLIYGITIMMFCVGTSFILQYSDAQTMNLSLLTSNFFSLAISFLVFHTKFSWLYITGFLFIPISLFIFTIFENKKQSNDESE